jgi:GST-like protein
VRRLFAAKSVEVGKPQRRAVRQTSNRPVAGPTHDKPLPVGKHPLQLYSLAPPNGQKVPILLESCSRGGHEGAELTHGRSASAKASNSQRLCRSQSEFQDPGTRRPQRPEPCARVRKRRHPRYLAEKFGEFLPASGPARAETLSWLFWQMGSAPFLGGGFGHFFAYAPTKIEYAINRYAMEAKRQLDVLNRRLAESEYIAGADYSIADIAIWPWYGGIVFGRSYPGADEFLAIHEYEHLVRWAKQIDARPAVQRGRIVNKLNGDPAEQLHERHDASDFEQRTQDKIAPEAVKDDAI